ncbi:MAG: bifunctional folylpolyglutamate synthase/dihydrofolate synthase [Bacteroidia bacterium]|nr:bifunctional folylpolyglutamate synthase/dihydrofolate synthase [Bacteroidia bacterium]
MDHHAVTYTDTVEWLFGLQFFGIKLGLDNITSMAARWGNPHRAFPVVHIAGTNGKGSTASFIAAALTAAGYRTGLYTSPHLEDFTERIRIDGAAISSDDVVRYAAALRPEVERLNATFFEITTLMAFQYFADNRVDVAVIETGMGGRLDATNIVVPACSVITGVALDHTEYLGSSIEAIAFEKAGIIKRGVPVVSGTADVTAARVIADRAAALGAPLVPVFWQGRAEWTDFDRMCCELGGMEYPVVLGLVGEHQARNAALSLAALHRLKEAGFDQLTDEVLRDGFRNVRSYSGLRGRLHRLASDPELVVDAGHNPEGLRVMLDAWCALRSPAATHAVFGVMKSKDHHEMIREIATRGFASVTFVQATAHDAQPMEALLDAAARQGLEARSADTVHRGVEAAFERAHDGSALLFGSHYVLGEYFRAMREHG